MGTNNFETMDVIIFFAFLALVSSGVQGSGTPTLEQIESNICSKFDIKSEPDSFLGIEMHVSLALMADRNAEQIFEHMRELLALLEEPGDANAIDRAKRIKVLKYDIGNWKIISKKAQNGLRVAWGHLLLLRKSAEWSLKDYELWRTALHIDAVQFYFEILKAIGMVLEMEGISPAEIAAAKPAEMLVNGELAERICAERENGRADVSAYGHRWGTRIESQIQRALYVAGLLDQIESHPGPVKIGNGKMKNVMKDLVEFHGYVDAHHTETATQHILRDLIHARDVVKRIISEFEGHSFIGKFPHLQKIYEAQRNAAGHA